MKPIVTIVVPTWNEAKNIKPLVFRIDKAFRKASISYQLIFVDDRSTDETLQAIRQLRKDFPIRLLHKKKTSPRGKAYSLLSGFAFCKSDIIAMIDADLQYPPEALPEMVQKLRSGTDIVIANRVKRHTKTFRKTASFLYRFVFGKLLHGFDHDIQSGMKVFRKEIIERIHIKPSQWMFDLEFLTAARSAGYKIESVTIEFAKRQRGKPKIHFVQAAFEMSFAALKLKLQRPRIIPFHPNHAGSNENGFHYKGTAFKPHAPLTHKESAFFNLTFVQKLFIGFFLGLLVFSFVLNWHMSAVAIVALLTIVYFTDLIFNLFLLHQSFVKSPEIRITKQELQSIVDAKLPTYTIFCPLYKEWNVLHQFVTAINQLDYPKEKLQVLLLLEEDDDKTIQYAKKLSLSEKFKTIIVPHSLPKTKPKALNFGLQFAKGDYCVVYDAEDIPDPLQLKKTILAFQKSDSSVYCIQAKLNFYNPHHNILTRIFTAEYSLWFDLILTGLQSIQAPIPLGGTSNHFRIHALKELKGWDSFNVTEDCDLGVRLAKRGFRTAIIDSTTFEEANSNLLNWFRQRTRWIKGYIQTYLVHMRNPLEFWRVGNKKSHLPLFQLVVGGKVLSMFINPLMWIITIAYFGFRPLIGEFIESFFPTPVMYMGVFSLVFGNFLYLYYYMIGCAKRKQFDLIKYAFLVPFYWLGMSIAAWHAVYQMFRKPHFWPKTVHGYHLTHNDKTQGQEKSDVASFYPGLPATVTA